VTPSPRQRPSSLPPVQYKGGDLEGERGPGLGCFWLQIVVLAILVVVTPIGVNLGWPDWLNALLLFATIAVLLLSGQTIIFLLRLVAAERREGRRRPVASRSRTVGELEDQGSTVESASEPGPDTAPAADDSQSEGAPADPAPPADPARADPTTPADPAPAADAGSWPDAAAPGSAEPGRIRAIEPSDPAPRALGDERVRE
jgi:hypothetical protein